MRRHLAAALLAALPMAATAAPPPSPFAGTMAEMTYVEVEDAAAKGAVALWAIGAIEAHGPHLPLSVDVTAPQGELASVQARLGRLGVRSVIVPPYYWGVNRVTGSFGGSIDVRPETMAALIGDVVASLGRMGFKEVYLVTGHFDAAHGRTIIEAVKAANAAGGPKARFVVPAALGQRLGLTPGEPGFVLVDAPPAQANPPAGDLHAGEAETSLMLHLSPGEVRAARKDLPTVTLTPERLTRWREGYAIAREITPDGYVGAPAQASAVKGKARLETEAAAMAQAIAASR